jgi:hypothetical protein
MALQNLIGNRKRKLIASENVLLTKVTFGAVSAFYRKKIKSRSWEKLCGAHENIVRAAIRTLQLFSLFALSALPSDSATTADRNRAKREFS